MLQVAYLLAIIILILITYSVHKTVKYFAKNISAFVARLLMIENIPWKYWFWGMF